MTPEKLQQAHELGTRIFSTDPWLAQDLKELSPETPVGLALVEVRKLGKDRHFQSNWMPVVKRAASPDDPLLFLKHVWEGYTTALLNSLGATA